VTGAATAGALPASTTPAISAFDGCSGSCPSDITTIQLQPSGLQSQTAGSPGGDRSGAFAAAVGGFRGTQTKQGDVAAGPGRP
jgi:hypothetical protein